jgi:hypothetical protein
MTGKPWYVALRERITGPLRLTSIRCGCEPGTAVVAGYTSDNKPSQRIDMTVPSGSGALVGNAEDLARWAAALHGGKVLKPATYQAMITPSLPAGAEEEYAFGLGRAEVRGLSVIGHNGGIFGFNTESLYNPDKKLFVAVLGNSDDREPGASTTARRLLAKAAGNPYPEMIAQALDLSQIEPFVGVYKSAAVERRVFVKDGKLLVQRGGGSPNEAFSAGDGRFFYGPRSLSYFDLARGADGKPIMTFHANGATKGVQGRWVGPIPPEAAAVEVTAAQREALVGSYAAGPMILTIANGDKGLTAQLTGQPSIALEATGPRDFRTVGVDARLTFEEEGGKVARVTLRQGGQTVPFERQ